jgi:hypothetical protein
MRDSDDAAVEMARVCLEKSGFHRNIQKIIEAIEEEIFGNGGALNSEDFESAEDYVDIMYPGFQSLAFDIIRDTVVNRNINGDFTQREKALLDAMSIDGLLRVDTQRLNGARHSFAFAMHVPTSHINLASTKIMLMVELNDLNWGNSTYEIQAKQFDEVYDSQKLKKLTTLISLI